MSKLGRPCAHEIVLLVSWMPQGDHELGLGFLIRSRDASFCCLLSTSYMTAAVFVVNAAAGMVKWDTSALHLLSPASLGSSRLVTRAVRGRTNTRRFSSETGQWPVLV